LTPYAQPNGFEKILGVTFGNTEKIPSLLSPPERILGNGLPEELKLLQGIRRLQLGERTQSLVEDSLHRPIVTEYRVGLGRVWYQAADLRGYSLGTLLGWLLELAGEEKSLGIYGAEYGKCATNVLLSLREYKKHLAVLLRNQDNYPKRLRIAVSLPDGNWTVRDPLDEGAVVSPSGQRIWSREALQREGILIEIDPRDFRLLILERQGEG
jgi:hypothetical protein